MASTRSTLREYAEGTLLALVLVAVLVLGRTQLSGLLPSWMSDTILSAATGVILFGGMRIINRRNHPTPKA